MNRQGVPVPSKPGACELLRVVVMLWAQGQTLHCGPGEFPSLFPRASLHLKKTPLTSYIYVSAVLCGWKKVLNHRQRWDSLHGPPAAGGVLPSQQGQPACASHTPLHLCAVVNSLCSVDRCITGLYPSRKQIITARWSCQGARHEHKPEMKNFICSSSLWVLELFLHNMYCTNTGWFLF